MRNIELRLKALEQSYQIKVGAGLMPRLGREARACLGPEARRVAVISNPKVFDLFGQVVMQSLRETHFQPRSWLMPDGERYKSLQTLDRALAFLSGAGVERTDAVLALGGGVVGDLAGFAAATYLRGIALIHAPTTLLAQIDASVGGKTGVNMPAGKNLVGAFHQPRLVLIDTRALASLPRRELTAGWCEAVKHGAVGSRKLFAQTCRFLRDQSTEQRLTEVVAAHCRFKASIVARDQKEDVARVDGHSRRILNFGHTVAHALEAVTSYRRFRHGEAVGYGMLVAGEISKYLGMLTASELELLRAAVKLCGRLPRADDLPIDRIMRMLAGDKKTVRGAIKWVLLERIGQPRIVDGREITGRCVRTSLASGLQRLS